MQLPISWLAEWIPDVTLDPTTVAERLTMAGIEVESIAGEDASAVLTLAVTANRPDCLNIRGLVREVAATLECAWRTPFAARELELATPTAPQPLSATIAPHAPCLRYAAVRMGNVKIAPSPVLIQQRLQASGVRPINNVVDATNYVMLELGHPLHAFDARDIHGDAITIRAAGAASEFITLDGAPQKITSDDLLICDPRGAVALAGIMGGANSEIRADTIDIILEAACFVGSSVRKTSRRLGLVTESSRRFERGVNPATVREALQRVANLIHAWSGANVTSQLVDEYPTPVQAAPILLPVAMVQRVLGIALPTDHVQKILTNLGCVVNERTGEWQITPPLDRPDLTRAIDCVEEIARIAGYHRIPAQLPTVEMTARTEPAHWAWWQEMRPRLTALGIHESLHYAFVPLATHAQVQWLQRAPVQLANPLGNEPTAMATTLAAGLLESVQRNARRGQHHLALFECRPVFWRDEKGECVQALHLGIALAGDRLATRWTQSAAPVDFYDGKGVVEAIASWSGASAALGWHRDPLPRFLHPGQSTWLTLGEGESRDVGYCGLLHPQVAAAYNLTLPVVLVELVVQPLVHTWQSAQIQAEPPPKFPAIRRDVAFLLPHEISVERLLQTLRAHSNSWLVEVTPFDVYTGKHVPAGQKSIAVALYYQESTRTLTDDEVQQVHATMIAKTVELLGATVR